MDSFQGSKPSPLPAWFWMVVVLLLLCQAGACLAGAAPSLTGRIDLRPFYASGIIVRSGHAAQLYDYELQRQVQNAVVSQRMGALPFLYPPFAALLFVPLSFLSYRGAFFATLAINLLLLVLTAQVLRPCLPFFSRRRRLVLPAIYGCLFAVSVTLMQGQISLVLLLLVSAAWVLLHEEHPFPAGLLLSITLIKFQLALPIILLFLLWRKGRVILGFLLGALVLGAASWAMVGSAGLLHYKDSLTGMAQQGASNALAAKQRYGMFPTDMPNLHGLSYGLAHGEHWGLILNLALCSLVLVFAACQKPSLAVALPAAMLVSYHMQPHDLALLLLPLTLLADSLLLRYIPAGAMHAMPPRPASSLRPTDITFLLALLFLLLPLAALLMSSGANYLVSLTVVAIMVAVARTPETLPATST